MPIVIIDREGSPLVIIDQSSRTFARHLERGDIIATGEPLVYRLIRASALVPRTPEQKRRDYLKAQKS